MRKRPSSRRKGTVAQPEDDKALWDAFAKNIDPLDLKGRVPDTDSEILAEMLRKDSSRRSPNMQGTRSAETGQKPKQPAAIGPRGVRTQGASVGAKAPVADMQAGFQAGAIAAKDVRRIGKGHKTIDARIDLHGMRQNEAHAALRVFLFRAMAKGHRLVLVITGKGTSERAHDAGERFGAFVHEGGVGRGVLKRSVPIWLGEPDLRAIVVGYTAAHIRHGGEGALYVQIRKARS